MASPNPLSARLAGVWRWLPYAAGAALFLWLCAQFYLPGQGFTSLVIFSGRESANYLPELRAQNYYADENSYGYDAQYYAQIAMHPQIGDPVLRRAVDSLPYRARRILFCWTAYGLGAGQPAAVLQVFALQNILAWLLLGWVLRRWFPPTSGQNLVRWFAVMFTMGLCFSVRASLVDGPSLLLIAWGMLLLEKGRPLWAAVVLGVAGLGKETNILAGSAFVPTRGRDRTAWRAAIGRAVLVVAPLAVWLAFLKIKLGTGSDAGARNFAGPFVGYAHKWQETLRPFFEHGSGAAGRFGLYVLIGLTVQWLFFALRPRWRDPWWRVGASFAVLMVVLGDAVWEGYPGAAPRVLLPMTLAFNLLVPRGLRWWPVLLLGNLLVLPTVDTFVPPGRESSQVHGSRELRVEEATGDEVAARFREGDWYWLERSYFSYWRWSKGPAEIALHNPHAYALTVDLSFRLKSSDARTVAVRIGGREVWQGETEQTKPPLVFRGLRLPPGDTLVTFDTDRPAANPPNHDPRQVAFRVADLRITVVGRSAE